MKKILLLFLLISFSGLAQKTKADVFIEKHVTSTQRDALTVPAGETWHIYNSTTGQNEVNVAGGGWVVDAGELADDLTPQLSGALDMNSQTVTGDVIPTTNDTYDLGSAAAIWDQIFAETYFFKDVDADTDTFTLTELTGTYAGDFGVRSDGVVRGVVPDDGSITDPLHLVTKAYGDANYAGGSNLATADQSIPGSTTRVIDTDASGSVLSFENVGTEIMTVGDNNDNAVQVLGLESLSGNTIALVSPVKFPSFDTGSTPASGYDRALVEDSGDGEPYYSDGTNWNQLLFLEADIITEAEIADGAIQEEHLKAVNSPTDEYVLTYEATTGDFEWQAAAAASLPVVDTSELIEGSADDTKLLRFENDTHIPTSTTVVITAPSADLDLEEVVISDVTGVTGADAVDNIMSLTQSEYDAITPDASTVYIITDAKEEHVFIIPITANGADVAVDTNIVPFFVTIGAITVTEVHATVNVAGTTGVTTFDINENGTSILSTKLTIDSAETTTVTAATAAVISDSAIADFSQLSFDVDGVSTTAPKHATIYIHYTVD